MSSACRGGLGAGCRRFGSSAVLAVLLLAVALPDSCLPRGVAAQAPKAVAKPRGPPRRVARTARPPPPEHALSLPNWCSAGPYADDDEPLYTEMTRSASSHKVYHNAFWHAHKWYALLPPPAMLAPGEAPGVPEVPSTSQPGPNATSPLEEGISVNCNLIRLPLENVTGFTDNMRAGFLPGTTLLVDFPFPAFPDNLGHWAELMLPTFSVLLAGQWKDDTRGTRGRYVDRILLPNLRKEMSDWFKEMLALAVSPGVRRGGAPVPPIIDHTDLDAFPKLSWLAFENLLVVQDRYTHPERRTGFVGADHGDLWRYDGCARYVDGHLEVGFARPEHAQEFRTAAYKRAGLPPPAPWVPGTPPALPADGGPRALTLLLAHEDYPPVVNWLELQTVLRRLARANRMVARTVTLSTDAPFASHLDTFARSAVVVGRHGPLMATAALMQPGSALVELLPYKWEWLGIAQMYRNMTQSTGDVHHFAWRANDFRLAHYDHENYTRYAPWTPDECSARECLMVHARAGLTVDLREFEYMLAGKLPGVVSGRPVEELRTKWPAAT
ncbi:hypothetical protein HYH03_013007 [Edaphochlamys debaryana]|uniref:Glycosyltransferase n=1 Tax=Edaphochlamys debaryana TaxID=47281 RepID=A0A835XRN0_9CHLO|nr:hypothetical protein HYH03_013007 [Edaphochlamys debaryana]|eukprot:KAG2488504.1 hypothetical protein HYH03_013007 [Edaphochlamys debaryana]